MAKGPQDRAVTLDGKRWARRALAAGGVMASMAAAGLGAAPAQAATLYACYSNSTDALYHTTSSTCKTGFTSISWNQAGPQGPPGAQGAQGAQGAKGAQGTQGAQGSKGAEGAKGAQGPQGARGAQGAKGVQGAQGSKGAQGHQGSQGVQGAQGAGAVGFTRPTSSVSLAKSVATVVASIATTGNFTDYAVVANAVVRSNGRFSCFVRANSVASPRSSTPPGIASIQANVQTVTTNGIVGAGSGSTIQEICVVENAGPEKVTHATITAVRLSSGQKQTRSQPAKPRNRFSMPTVHRAETK